MRHLRQRHKGSPQTARGLPERLSPSPCSPGPGPAGKPRRGTRGEPRSGGRLTHQCARRGETEGEGGERPAEAGGSRGEAGSRRPAPAQPGRAREGRRGPGPGCYLPPDRESRSRRNTKNPRHSLAPTRSPRRRGARHWPSPARGARRILYHKDPTRAERKQPPRAPRPPFPYSLSRSPPFKSERKKENRGIFFFFLAEC